MNAQSRLEAQQRADEIGVFQRELNRLTNEGVLKLSESQHLAVSEHHNDLLANYTRSFDIDADVKAKQLSLGMRAASFLGALALGASVLFLFYQFWGRLSTVVQVSLLLMASLGSFAGAIWVQGRDSSGYFTKLAALLAFVCFVLNVVMLGQIFNITPSDKALIPFAALAFLLAYSCDLRLLLAAGILCVMAFIAARTGTLGGLYWLDFGQRPENFFPAALLFFVLPSLLHHKRCQEFAPIYRVFGILAFLFPILVLSNWAYGSYLDFDRKVIEGTYQLVGFAVSGTSIWYGARRGWSEVLNTGLVFFVIFLYTKLFDWWWELMPKYLFFLILGLIAVLILLVLKRLRMAATTLFREGAS